MTARTPSAAGMRPVEGEQGAPAQLTTSAASAGLQSATATGEWDHGSAAGLSESQLEILTSAARELGMSADEVIGDVTRYLGRLPGDTLPTARAEAMQKAVQGWAARAEGSQRASVERPRTRSGKSVLDRAMETLVKKQGMLSSALKAGRDGQIQRAVRLLESALAEAVAAAHQVSRMEGWAEARLEATIRDLKQPAELLLGEAKEERRDVALSGWALELSGLAAEGLTMAAVVLEENSLDYEPQEVEDEIKEFGALAGKMQDLLQAGVDNGFRGLPRFEAVKAEVYSALDHMKEAVEWLDSVKGSVDSGTTIRGVVPLRSSPTAAEEEQATAAARPGSQWPPQPVTGGVVPCRTSPRIRRRRPGGQPTLWLYWPGRKP